MLIDFEFCFIKHLDKKNFYNNTTIEDRVFFLGTVFEYLKKQETINLLYFKKEKSNIIFLLKDQEKTTLFCDSEEKIETNLEPVFQPSYNVMVTIEKNKLIKITKTEKNEEIYIINEIEEIKNIDENFTKIILIAIYIQEKFTGKISDNNQNYIEDEKVYNLNTIISFLKSFVDNLDLRKEIEEIKKYIDKAVSEIKKDKEICQVRKFSEQERISSNEKNISIILLFIFIITGVFIIILNDNN